MSNKVVILGAGFSKPAGVPMQASLLNEIRNINLEELPYEFVNIYSDKEKIDSFLCHLFGIKGKKKDYSMLLLEDIYTIIDSAILKQQNIGIFDLFALYQVRIALDRVLSFIIHKNLKKEELVRYEKKLKTLIGLTARTKIDFIDLNWDILLETLLQRINQGYDYMIPFSDLKKRVISTEKKIVSVLKPHGSLNWMICPICEKLVSEALNFSPSNESNCPCSKVYYEKNEEKIKDFQNIFNSPFQQQRMPIIISPTFLKATFITQLNQIFQYSLDKLVNATDLIFIGYSLPVSDHDIRNLLLRAYAINKPNKITVYLKENDPSKIAILKKNYETIYHGLKIDFHWNGFVS